MAHVSAVAEWRVQSEQAMRSRGHAPFRLWSRRPLMRGWAKARTGTDVPRPEGDRVPARRSKHGARQLRLQAGAISAASRMRPGQVCGRQGRARHFFTTNRGPDLSSILSTLMLSPSAIAPRPVSCRCPPTQPPFRARSGSPATPKGLPRYFPIFSPDENRSQRRLRSARNSAASRRPPPSGWPRPASTAQLWNGFTANTAA